MAFVSQTRAPFFFVSVSVSESVSSRRARPLLARRAAVCDIEPKGSFKRIWTWPAEAAAYFSSADASIYRSDTATANPSGAF